MKQFASLCGNTPFIKISDRIYGKLETYNPTGSIKDRMISYVVNKAIVSGKITSRTTICEATSGNTGIALSAVAASLGLECVIFMPENMSAERKQMMAIYGAKIIDAPADNFIRAIEMRDEFLETNKLAWSPKQFSNIDNIECHFLITAPEIFKDVVNAGFPWSAFIHGAGTGGTIEGIRRFIHQNELDTRVVMVHPDESPHGIQGIADGKEFLAKNRNMDEIINVETTVAIERAKQFTKDTGILVGISSGANIVASERWAAENPNIPGIIATVLCDRGERYMSVFQEQPCFPN